MKTAMIRKALLPVLAASAVMVSTPALAQNFSVSLSFGSPGYSYGYGHAPRDLNQRARALARHVDRLAWSGGVNRREARRLSRELNRYERLEHRYAHRGFSRAEYRDLDRRLDRIQWKVQRASWSRW
ncbi:MAG TPA: hypothetical protein VD906_02520 [Caulobacteraceae bacterium]|nr:hypothetical protein [Caulobacteraceae bacterium]